MPAPGPRSGRSHGRWLVVVVVLALLGACAVLLWLVITARPRHGAGGDADAAPSASLLERWATGRLESFLDALLVPTIRIGQGRYEAPRTFVFDDVALEQDGVRFLSVGRLTLALTEIPTGNGPLRIDALRLEDPLVVLETRADGGLVGFSDLVEADAGSTESRARLSDALRMQRIELADGRIVHRGSDGRETGFDGITIALDAAHDGRDPGAFGFSGTFGRSELVEASLRGCADLDELVLVLEQLDLRVDVGDEPPDAVPPTVRELIEKYGLRGIVELKLAGTMPFSDPWGGAFSIHAFGDDVYADLPDRRIDLDDVELDAHVFERRIVVESLDVVAAQGRAAATGEIVPEERWLTHADLRIDGMRYEEFFNAITGIATTTRGRATADATIDLELDDFVGTARAAGRLRIDPGRLSVIPWFEALGRAIGWAARLGTGGDERDRGETDFEIVPGEVRFRNLKIVVPGMATRGEGEMRYDGTVDFRLNAGPIERLQEATGPIGSFFGAITDRLGTYHVTGPYDKPSVRYRPFGL